MILIPTLITDAGLVEEAHRKLHSHQYPKNISQLNVFKVLNYCGRGLVALVSLLVLLCVFLQELVRLETLVQNGHLDHPTSCDPNLGIVFGRFLRTFLLGKMFCDKLT